jgi:hypothetical protein
MRLHLRPLAERIAQDKQKEAVRVVRTRFIVVCACHRIPRLAAAVALGFPPGGSSVIAGHFGFAAAVKAKATAVPLWALMLACQWLSVLAAGVVTLAINLLGA